MTRQVEPAEFAASLLSFAGLVPAGLRDQRCCQWAGPLQSMCVRAIGFVGPASASSQCAWRKAYATGMISDRCPLFPW